MQIAEQLDNCSMVAIALGGLVETSLWIDASGHLEALIDRAIDYARRAGDPIREANAGRIRAVLALKRHQYSAAFDQTAEARRLALENQSDLLAAECTAVMAVAKKRAHGESLATALRQEATAHLDRHRAFLETEWVGRSPLRSPNERA